MDLTDLHARLAVSFILYMLAASGWNFLAAARRRLVSPSTWGVLAIGELLALVEVALGVLLYAGGDRPARLVHLLYGLTAILTLPAYYLFSRGRDDRRASLAYGALCLFLAFAGYRAVITGS